MSYLGSARSRFNRASTACIAAFPSEIPFAYALRLSWSPIEADRKSTRLNSSHDQISYAVFCLKKKKSNYILNRTTQVLTSEGMNAHTTSYTTLLAAIQYFSTKDVCINFLCGIRCRYV